MNHGKSRIQSSSPSHICPRLTVYTAGGDLLHPLSGTLRCSSREYGGLGVRRAGGRGAYTAMGTGGQYITMLPKEDIVIAHKVNIDKDAKANVSPEGYDAILAMIIDSKFADSCP